MRRPAGWLRAKGRAALIALSRPARGEVAVSYGHRVVPAPGEPVEGGMVKFQRLQRAFPHRPRDFNLLYLGSSSLPTDEQQVIALARRRKAPVVVNQNGIAYPAWAGADTERLNDRLRGVLRAATHVVYQGQFCKEAADEFLGPPGRVVGDPHERGRHAGVHAGGARRTAGPCSCSRATSRRRTAWRRRSRRSRCCRTRGCWWRARSSAGSSSSISSGSPTASTSSAATPSATLPSLYRRAHVLLHPKVRDPCPNVVLEALACGVPVVHSASGGVPELVGDAGIGVASETTWEVDVPPAPAELAEAVRTVLASLEDYRARARARAVERFDLAPWIERHRALFSELVG